MEKEKVKPSIVPLDSVEPYEKEVAVTGVKIARLITRGRSGSELTLGVSWIGPGERSIWWSSEDTDPGIEGEHWYGPVLETYFCIQGRLRLHWNEGALDFGPNDAVYLAPGWRYMLENPHDEPATIVYNMYPSQE
jgi:mannose-6-phosphate isomerase-like protein (cupin superfamily)